jgi:hypothetical protein
VHAIYERLKEDATIDAHLVAMTEKQVTDDLRRSGETVHVRSDDSAWTRRKHGGAPDRTCRRARCRAGRRPRAVAGEIGPR